VPHFSLARGTSFLVLSVLGGDGLFVVFSDPAQCGRFALVLLQKVHQTKWEMYGLVRQYSCTHLHAPYLVLRAPRPLVHFHVCADVTR
jgi:hypothetical protein